jgi:glucose/mannose-6-phosphate isomerase
MSTSGDKAWPEGGAGEMFRLVASLPDQLRASAELPGLDAVAPDGAPPRRIVLCGMGGSAIAGDLLAPLAARAGTELVVWRDYGLPAWVRPDDTVICSSYSGDTEETLSGLAAAERIGCRRLAQTSGGTLAAKARSAGFPVVILPGGLPPRASLGYGLGGVARILERLGCLPGAGADLAEAADHLEAADAARRHPVALDGPAPSDPDGNPGCAELSRALQGRVPVLYTTDPGAHPVGARWKAQVNENSKLPAMTVPFPELDHNDLVGWCLPPELRRHFSLIILRCLDENPRMALRVATTRDLLQDQFASVHEVGVGRGGDLSRILSLVQYGDYLSCHLALQAGVDPVPVERIGILKKTLAAADAAPGA